MPTHDVTVTELNPALATGSGGGLSSSSVTEVNPTPAEASGGGLESKAFTEVNPTPVIGSGGGTRSVTNTEVNPTFPILASVTTNAASGITGYAADLNGTLVDEGLAGQACDCGFEWGLTTAYGNTTPTASKTTGQTFAQTIVLVPGTTYHFRSFATNSLGTAYGADAQFTTDVVTPTVTTDPATLVHQREATLNGTLVFDGGAACDCYFEWGLTTAYGNTTPIQSKTTGQTFSQNISNLTRGTVYHFRALANNGF